MDNIIDYISRFNDFFIGIAIFIAAILLGILVKFLVFKLLDFYNRHTDPQLIRSLTRHLNGPLSLFIPLLFVSMALPAIPFSTGTIFFLRRVAEILNIATFAWVLVQLTNVVLDIVKDKFQVEKPDNYKERKLYTQVQFIKKLAVILIVFVAISLILFSFESVRTLGTGLLTSAGVAGIVVGLAAQRSIANLLAGLQVAFTQPIRLDDVLVVEGEWGRVEEITLTYVVLKIWDSRRLVLPLNYFIEKPFQNWTRTGSDLLGTVFLYTDYSIPLDALRKEFDRILAETDLWDKRVSVLQVTEAKERTLELRLLVSANNSSIAFDLRCLVREKMIKFIQQNYPESLPRTRAEFTGDAVKQLAKISTQNSNGK
ncbi:mechanosensitive ion channel family protein [Pontibacter silvestris]|uniref:Mechanosensitive ion channel family protein n=1 Tax=Pontibacter silvestris TaxID=2305183 RepID=A0ABW4WX24_9BACT|nr:mechanosensitive ion channel domain-containing protein [Pontibacter silvestris]MCC9138386.1 mechanosensitive ion channel family protein [Pontibacter silvestris]